MNLHAVAVRKIGAMSSVLELDRLANYTFARFRISFIRDCQPLPFTLSLAMTSGSVSGRLNFLIAFSA